MPVFNDRFNGDGSFDVRGGDGYGEGHSFHGGGGAGGRFAIYYKYNDFVGQYTSFNCTHSQPVLTELLAP